MTACVNRKHTKKVAAVVTASLVGALSLGVAPVAAMATDSVDMQFAEGGIEGSEFAEGDVVAVFTKVSDSSNFTPTPDVDGVPTVTAGNMPFTVTATQIRPAGSASSISVTPGNDYKVSVYHADEEGAPTGSPLAGGRVYEAGEYVLTVTPLTGSDYIGQTFTYNFQVVGEQIVANAPYEHGDQADTELMFTGSALDLDFQINGVELVEGKDYTVKYNKQGGGSSDEIVDAGTYTATLTGLGIYGGTSATTAPFTVDQYQFAASTTVVIDPFTGQAPTKPSRAYYTNGDPKFDVELNTDLLTLTPTTDIDAAGGYTFTVTPDDAAVKAGNIRIVGTKTATGVKVDAFASFLYNGTELQDSYDILPGQSFNPAAVSTTYNGTSLGQVGDGYTVASITSPITNNGVAAEYKITFTYNENGVPVSGTALNGKVLSASKTVTVRLWKGAIDADTQLWVYGPDSSTVAINSYAKGYDGELLDADSFLVTDKDQTVTNANGALEAKLYDAEGNEVANAIAAGEYTLKVTSEDYLLSGTTEMPITIGKVDLTTLEIGELEQWNDVAGQWYLPLDTYNVGSNLLAINSLDLLYNTGNEAADPDGFDDYKGMDLIPDNADVTVEINDEGTWKPVAVIDEAGDYRVTVTIGDDIISNFELPEGENSVTIEFTVAEKTVFSDVQPDMWYYEAVIRAARNGYVHGDAGLTTFRPEATITRGEVAVVLYNMSGMSRWWGDNENNSGSYVEGQGWKTGFDDVDGTAFYAEAIAWAKKTGVVNGDAGTNNFRPDATVTSEEFAAMLANYAEKVNQDKTVAEADPASLEGVKGAEGVSEWAQKSVAWAVESEIMGNNGADLDAKGSIQRARVAAMAVNYQPNAKDTNL